MFRHSKIGITLATFAIAAMAACSGGSGGNSGENKDVCGDQRMAVPVTGVTLTQTDWSKSFVACPAGSPAGALCWQLQAQLQPADASHKTVLWTSSDPTYATVSGDGLVTRLTSDVKPLTVTATTEDGCFTATVTGSAEYPKDACWDQKNAVPVTSVALNVTDWYDSTKIETCQDPLDSSVWHFCWHLVATVTPADATNGKILWSASDTATITDDGLVTLKTPAGSGSVPLTVTATTQDGCHTAITTGSASCPMVYAANGAGKFDYVTDLQGPIVGFPPSYPMAHKTALFTDDWVVLNELKADSSGNYQVKVRETQAEITYLDDVKLMPVDVPDGYELASSSAEQTYGNGYVNPHRLHALKKAKELRSATDWQGRDVTAQLRSTDGKPASIEGNESPSYVLDFGKLDAAHAKLVLQAWTLYSPTYGKALEKPSVSVKDAAGKWTEVKTFGLPAGDEKAMVWDLSGKFLSKDHRVKVSLGTRPWVRWALDSVKLDDSTPVEPVVGAELQPSSAALASGGLVTMELPTASGRGFVRDDHRPFNGAGMGTGRFTRYGDVKPLVSRSDDEFVIMGMGDEVTMTFAGAAPPKPGFHRVMVMKVMQFYKAPYVDLNVEPLPFKGMSSYPYPASEHYPDDAEHRAYLKEYNTRVEGRMVTARR